MFAAASGSKRLLQPLTNPVPQYVGNISYSLHLWHFPAIIPTAAYLPELGPTSTIATVMVIAVLSVLCFHLVEDPIRRSNWLEPRASRRAIQPAQPLYDPVALRRVAFAMSALLTVSVVVFAAYVFVEPVGDPPAWSAPPRVGATNTVTGAGIGTDSPVADTAVPSAPADRLTVQINAALSPTTFPPLSLSIDVLPNSKAPEWTENGCGTVNAGNTGQCVYGDAKLTKTVAAVGDSIALSWLPGLVVALNTRGYPVYSFVAGECPEADVAAAAGRSATVSRAGVDHRAWAMTAVQALKPDLIVVSDSHLLVKNLVSGAEGDARIAEWQAGDVKPWTRLVSIARVQVLSAPPGTKSLINCAPVRAVSADCVDPVVW